MLLTWLQQTPGWVLPGASADLNFAAGTYYPAGVDSLITTTRASNETTLLPASAAGASYLTLANNVSAIGPGVGLQSYAGATNRLLNSTAPVTQTTASLGTGTYTLWVNGTGSATSSAGSATGSSFGIATNGSPNTFTLSGAGTVTITVSGSLNAFQLESGSFGTPLIITAGSTASRSTDSISATTALSNLIPITTATLLFDMGPVGWGADGTDHVLLAFLQSGSTPGVGRFSGGAINFNDGVGYRTSQTYTNGAAFKYAVAYGGTAINASLNGGTVSNYATYAGSIAGTAAPFKIGSGSGSAFWNGTFKRIAAFPSIQSVIGLSGT